MARPSKEKLAMIAVAGSGVVWGVLWLPLRALTDNGIEGSWAIVLFYVLPMVILIPLYGRRWRRLAEGSWSLNVAGFLAGTSLVLYAGALLFTNVVHAMLLYYLTPLWSTLLARLVLGECISVHRWVTMVLGFMGLLVIFRIDTGFPWPRNVGDWMGLAAGVIWAAAAVQMRKNDRAHGVDFTLVYFVWGSIAAVALALLPLEGAASAPSWQAISGVLSWLLPVVVFLVIPPAIAVMWGAAILSPGILAILFMTEITAGTVTAALWAGEPFGLREVLGITLITAAGLWEPIHGLTKTRFRTGVAMQR